MKHTKYIKQDRGELVFDVFEEVQRLGDSDLRIGQTMKILEARLKEDNIDLFNVENDVLLKYIKKI